MSGPCDPRDGPEPEVVSPTPKAMTTPGTERIRLSPCHLPGHLHLVTCGHALAPFEDRGRLRPVAAWALPPPLTLPLVISTLANSFLMHMGAGAQGLCDWASHLPSLGLISWQLPSPSPSGGLAGRIKVPPGKSQAPSGGQKDALSEMA